MLYPAELQAHMMERVMGIEPTQSAWKAEILAIELHPHVRSTTDDLIIISTIFEFVNTFFHFFEKLVIFLYYHPKEPLKNGSFG